MLGERNQGYIHFKILVRNVLKTHFKNYQLTNIIFYYIIYIIIIYIYFMWLILYYIREG